MEHHAEGDDTPERIRLDEFDSAAESVEGEDPVTDRGGARAKPEKVRKAPEGSKPSIAKQALERVPTIEILTDPEEISDKALKGRAGRYYSESQTLFVNGLYPIIERMSLELQQELEGTGEPEIVRAECLKAARRAAAFRVGKVTCYAISKRLSEEWSADDLERATSPEALSMAADDYKQGLPVAKKWARDMIKLSKVEKVDAA